MSFFARLFGLKQEPKPQSHGPLYGDQPLYGEHAAPARGPITSDEQAIARYRYMLRTAPPETIEQAHEEAFAKLTPEQRAIVLRELNGAVPAHERVPETPGHSDDPRSLARLATRAELRNPGTIERTLGGQRHGGMMGGMGGAGMMMGTIFGALAMGFVGSMIAEQFMESFGGEMAEEFAPEELAMEEPMGGMEDFGGFEEF